MNFELKSNTSTKINEGQLEVQLPPVWKMQKNLLQVVHQVATNEMGKTRPVVNKNQDHPLLNYLSKNTPPKLKNNFMLSDPQLQMQKLPQKCLLLQCALISLDLTRLLIGI